MEREGGGECARVCVCHDMYRTPPALLDRAGRRMHSMTAHRHDATAIGMHANRKWTPDPGEQALERALSRVFRHRES